MSSFDHYRVLNVEKSAGDIEIKAAYKRLVRLVHPDVGGDASEFLLVKDAYETLGDPRRRADYDGSWSTPEPVRASRRHTPFYETRNAPPPPPPSPNDRRQPADFIHHPPPHHAVRRTPRSPSRPPGRTALLVVGGVTLSGLLIMTIGMIIRLTADPRDFSAFDPFVIPPTISLVLSLASRRTPAVIKVLTFGYAVLLAAAAVGAASHMPASTALFGLTAAGIFASHWLVRRFQLVRTTERFNHQSHGGFHGTMAGRGHRGRT